jgi:membrane fusion protein, multidrug efflux system
MRRGLWAVLIGAGMLAAGCGGENQRVAQKAEIVPGLRVQKIRLRSVADELEAPGSVIAVSTAQVAARTMGTVLQVATREGDYVKREQVLAQLDERELVSHRSAAQAGAQAATAGVAQATKALAAAQAQADMMQKTYDRYSYLKEQKSVSPQEFDEIAAKQQAAQANLEQVTAALRQAEAGSAQAESEARAAESVASYARVVAPFDGRVIRRTVEPGSLISPGMPLFVVEDASRYQLDATLRQKPLALYAKTHRRACSWMTFSRNRFPARSQRWKPAPIPPHTLKARIARPNMPDCTPDSL